MKIEIEWECSYEATLRIQGRELKVKMTPGCTKLEGMKDDQTTNTLGGIIASELYGKIGDFMQAEAILCEEVVSDHDLTWKRMKNSLADRVADRAS